jgi:hypothetical protein
MPLYAAFDMINFPLKPGEFIEPYTTNCLAVVRKEERKKSLNLEDVDISLYYLSDIDNSTISIERMLIGDKPEESIVRSADFIELPDDESARLWYKLNY